MDHLYRRYRLMAKVFVSCALAVVISGATPGRSADAPPIRIGTIPIDGGAEVLFAREMGFFKQAGLNVELSTLANGPAIASAVVAGSLDIGFSNIVSLATAYKRHVPIKVLAPAGLYDSAAPVALCMVPASSPVKSAKDLTGKTFATNGLKNIGEFGPRAWIDKNGGDSSSVKFVEFSVSAPTDALVQNRVDAAIVVEPYISAAKKVARVLSNCYEAVANTFVISAYFTSDAWAQEHPAQAKAFQNVMRQTAVWARKNHALSGQMLVKYWNIDPSTLQNVVRADFGDALEPAAIQPTIDLAARYGTIDSGFSAADFLYRSP